MQSSLDIEFCERFLSPAERARATHDLASRGRDAIAVLRAIFSGEAKNSFGVAYSKLGTPIDCALVTVTLLGKEGKALECYVRQWLSERHPYAFEAARGIGSLEKSTIKALLPILQEGGVDSFEAAYVLLMCGCGGSDLVQEAVAGHPKAMAAYRRALQFHKSRGSEQSRCT